MKIKYKEYSDVKGKVRREVADGNLIPLMRGLYETDATVLGKYLARHIYGPSYLSFDYALSVYSLGVLIKEEGGYTYLIASPEKALCRN